MTVRWIGMKMSIALALCIVLLTRISQNITDQKQWWFMGAWGVLATFVLLAYSQEFQQIRKKIAVQKEYKQRLDWIHKERENYQKQRRVKKRESSYR